MDIIVTILLLFLMVVDSCLAIEFAMLYERAKSERSARRYMRYTFIATGFLFVLFMLLIWWLFVSL